MTKLIKNSKGSQGLKYEPQNYETAGDNLAAHIKGIDDALGNHGGGTPADIESGTYEPVLGYGANTSATAGGTTNHGFYARVGKIVQGMVNVRMIVANTNTDSYFDVPLPLTPSKNRGMMIGTHAVFTSGAKGGVVDFSASASNFITMRAVMTTGGSNQLLVCDLSFCYELGD
ncbi:hypothetical protein [Flavobacterium mesophilum]|uniref:hypothetical protein n=1 Tax=Flavobacterium mesophilum TaxID=3143495 RepID=UPI0031D4513C